MKTIAGGSLKIKLIITFTTLFIIVLGAVNIITFSLVNGVIDELVNRELMTEAAMMKSTIYTASDAAIRTYLRTKAEVSLEMAKTFYQEALDGKISEDQAKASVLKVLSMEKVGQSGYTYVLNSQGVLLYHPKPELTLTDISEYDFVREQMELKSGYVEYLWKNPDDTKERAKALSMAYFKPWDWIISVSAYKSEFSDLINVDDFKDAFTHIQFGKTGYPVLLDEKGTFLIHPEMQGRNLITEGNPQGEVIREVITKKDGFIKYPWQNPGEKSAKEKLTVFQSLPEYGWIVAASSYKDDFYGSVAIINTIYAGALFLSIFVVWILTNLISEAITKPAQNLRDTMEAAYSGDLSVQVAVSGEDEVSQLGTYFNKLIRSLRNKTEALETVIEEKESARLDLAYANENLEQIVTERTRKLTSSLEILRSTQSQLLQDIAEKDTLSQELREAVENAQKANFQKSEFLATASHELRTPLNGILGILQYMLSMDYSNLTAEQKETLELVYQSGNKLLFLLNDLLELSKVESGQAKVKQDCISMDAFLADKKFLFESLIRRIDLDELADVTFRVQRKTGTPDDFIADETKLGQIIVNMIANAVKFTEEGEVLLSVSVEGEELIFQVSDSGIGMSSDQLDHAFNRFGSSRQSKYSSLGGSGLGLSLCRELAELLGGKFTIASALNEGTTASFLMPLVTEIASKNLAEPAQELTKASAKFKNV